MSQDFFTSSYATVCSERIVYTPSQFARTSLLFLQETGSLQALHPHTSSRSNLSSYLFFTVLEGEGMLIYDGVEYPLVSGSHVFIDCQKPYSHSTDKNLWSLQWCHFNGPEMKSIYNKYQARGGKPAFSSDSSYGELLSSLYEMAASSAYVRDMKINSLLSNLLALLMEDAWNPENILVTEKQKNVQKVHDYLDEHYGEKILLEDLAATFFIDKYYLCEQFKEQYGVTVNDYLNSVRITEAKKLLRFTDQTMDEIAERIGVNGAAYFSRLFKKVEGISPSEFRKLW